MSLDSHEALVVIAPPSHSRPAPLLDTPTGMQPLPVRTPEEIRAVAAVFAQQERESATVAALLSGMVLRDVLADTFAEPAGDVEVELKEKKTEEN